MDSPLCSVRLLEHIMTSVSTISPHKKRCFFSAGKAFGGSQPCGGMLEAAFGACRRHSSTILQAVRCQPVAFARATALLPVTSFAAASAGI